MVGERRVHIAFFDVTADLPINGRLQRQKEGAWAYVSEDGSVETLLALPCRVALGVRTHPAAVAGGQQCAICRFLGRARN